MVSKRLKKHVFRVLAVALAGTLAANCGGSPPPAPIHAKLVVPPSGYVLLNEPVQVSFDRTVKAVKVVTVLPATDLNVEKQGRKLLVTAIGGWRPATTYELQLAGLTTGDGAFLKAFKASFFTQPRHGIAGFLVGGQPVTGEPTVPATAHVTISFTDPVNTEVTTPTLNGLPIAAGGFKWADDARSVEIGVAELPYQTYVFGVGGQPATATGELLTDVQSLTVHAIAVLPSNASSAIPAGFMTIPPLQIVIDDSGPARPQLGFQKADMVFEYISEYTVNRMTAIYFNHVPEMVGPVRSCRTINAFLVFAFQALLMCSGVARGTQHYIPGGGGHGTRVAPAVINDQETTTSHFFRSNLNFAPHNLFTSNTLAESIRSQINIGSDPSRAYSVDPPHPDIGLGQPADPPSVPLQGVTYSYDGGSQNYLRFERGAPFTEGTGPQLQVKNIVVLHVPFHNMDWSEDGCCAWSVWYDLLGTGPAELYSDGKLVHAKWHMGSAGQVYFANNTPIWFTDDATGNVIELNTGLTWVHVVGNGQNS